MRQIIDDFIYKHNDCYLLVADLGKFPLTKTTDRYIDVGLSESLMTNIAIGLALCGKKVFIYSAAQFVLSRAYDTIKHNIYENASRGNKPLHITFLIGGAGFLYSDLGIDHFIVDDLTVMKNLFPTIDVFFPYDSETTIDILNTCYNRKDNISYIRLCPDNSPDKIHLSDIRYDKHIYTIGWLVEKAIRLCNDNKLKTNVVPILNLKELSQIDNDKIVIYDNISLKDSNIENHLFIADNVHNFFSSDIEEVRRHYKFDDTSLLNFIKQHI